MNTLNVIRASLLALFAMMAMSTSILASPQSHGGGGGGDMMKMMRMMHQDGGQYGMSWKKTLTDAQRTKIDKIRLDYLKKKYPLKNKKKVLKTELALLVAQDTPNQRAIHKKIDEIVDLKRQLLRLRYAYKVEVRGLLNENQRVQFDTALLKKAQRGKRMGRH